MNRIEPHPHGVYNIRINSIEILTDRHGYLNVPMTFTCPDIDFRPMSSKLEFPRSLSHDDALKHVGSFVSNIIRISGAEKWSDVVGKYIRAEIFRYSIVQYGHIINNDWYHHEREYRRLVTGDANTPPSKPDGSDPRPCPE